MKFSKVKHVVFPYLIEKFSQQVFSKDLMAVIQEYNGEKDQTNMYINLAFTLGSFILPKFMIKSFT